MGHSSIAITVDLYGHLIPGSNRQAVDRLDEPVMVRWDGVGSATPAQPGSHVESRDSANSLKTMVRPAGIEPATYGFED